MDLHQSIYLVSAIIAALFLTTSAPHNFLNLKQNGAVAFILIAGVSLLVAPIFWGEVGFQSEVVLTYSFIAFQWVLVSLCLFVPQGHNLRYMMLCMILGKPIEKEKATLDLVVYESYYKKKYKHLIDSHGAANEADEPQKSADQDQEN